MIRVADVSDAQALLDIYAPYVRETAISFECEVPSPAEFRERIRQILQKYPYLVALRGEEIAGYAYAHGFHERAAYARSVESSIYVRRDLRRSGVGRELYAALEHTLSMQHILNVNACVTCPNGSDPYLTRGSFDFHCRLGFTPVGEFHSCGYKFGRWYNVAWLEKFLGEHGGAPLPVLDFPQIRGALEAELSAQTR